jgi:UDP-3-O-[3-hydroxymyristoyl] glucosamine N-acyltransferase
MSISLGELAVRFGCELRGDPNTVVDSVATLANAHPRALAFLANPKYRKELVGTKAAAVIVDPKSAADAQVAVLVSENPYVTYARIAAVLHAPPAVAPGVHPSAVVSADANVDSTAYVGPLVVIEAGAVIGARAFIGPHSIIESGVKVAEDVRLVSRVTLMGRAEIGPRCILHPGAVIGSDGFGNAPAKGGAWVKVPQVGSVRVGADVEVGANTTIDRGAIEDTIVDEGVRLDNQIQIGHNVRIGAHTAIAACVGIAGSVTIGKRCMIGGAVGISGHITIADDVVITGFSMVTHTITAAGVYSSGIPVEDARAWRRTVGRFKRLARVNDRLAALERKIGAPSGAQQEEDDV